MIGIDTNVLVRYLSQDDALQSPIANKLIDSLTGQRPGFIALVVLVELVWVIQGAYHATKPDVVAILEKLVITAEFVIESSAAVSQALKLYSTTNADFSDCLMVQSARANGCTEIVTFDIKAANRIGMTLL